jgi:hypothetical protein
VCLSLRRKRFCPDSGQDLLLLRLPLRHAGLLQPVATQATLNLETTGTVGSPPNPQRVYKRAAEHLPRGITAHLGGGHHVLGRGLASALGAGLGRTLLGLGGGLSLGCRVVLAETERTHGRVLGNVRHLRACRLRLGRLLAPPSSALPAGSDARDDSAPAVLWITIIHSYVTPLSVPSLCPAWRTSGRCDFVEYEGVQGERRSAPLATPPYAPRVGSGPGGPRITPLGQRGSACRTFTCSVALHVRSRARGR